MPTHPHTTDSARYGPNSALVHALFTTADTLTSEQRAALSLTAATAYIHDVPATNAALTTKARELAYTHGLLNAWTAARVDAPLPPGRPAAGHMIRVTLMDTAGALVLRDHLTTTDYTTLTTPWRTVIGPAHPDDATLSVQERSTR